MEEKLLYILSCVMDNAIIVYIVTYYILLYVGIYMYDRYIETIQEKWSRFVENAKTKINEGWVRVVRTCYEWWQCWKDYVLKMDMGDVIRWLLKNVCYAGVFIWLIWAFETQWFHWYKEHIAQYVNIPDALANILLGIYVVIIVLLLIVKSLYRHPLKWKPFGYVLLVISVLYVRYRFCSDLFQFTTLSFVDIGVTYVDVAIIFYVIYAIDCVLIEILRGKYIQKKFRMQEENFFYHDAPWREGEPDRLNFQKKVELHVEKIGTLTRSRSWTVGIVGPWGSGKTSYISMLKSSLPKDKYLVIPFNPRFAAKPAKIQELALEELADALKPYYSSIRSLIRKYMSALQLDGANGWVQVAFSMIKSAYGVTEIKKELQDVIERLPKQVVFVIDDFDRLTRDEILEVLKLIDGNANFKNIIYIAAYDHEQMEKMLGESYIDKYFCIEIHVPLSQPIDLINYLKEEIRKIVPAPLRGDKLVMSGEDVLLRHWTIFFRKVILTLRDAKRYLNILKSDILTIYSRNVETEDFMLLSLLKYHNTRLYELLYAIPNKYLHFGDVIAVDLSAENHKELDTLDQDILNELFPSKAEYNDRPCKIRKRSNFHDYFVRPDEAVERLELSELFDTSMDEQQLQSVIETTCKNETVTKDFLINFEQFGRRYIDDKKSFRRFLLIVLYFNRYGKNKYTIPETWDIFTDSFYSTINEQRHKQFIHEEVSSVIMEYYANNKWTIGDIGALGRVAVDLYYKKNKKGYVIKREEIEPIIRERFDEECQMYLNSQSEENFERLISIFYLCINRIDNLTSKIWLDEVCCKQMREVIEQAPKAYVDHFVALGGESSSSEVNYIACEGFWEQIFGSVDELERFMAHLDEEQNPRVKRMRNFWRLYAANDYKMIRFEHQGNVQKIIDNDLVEEVRELEELRSLEEEVKSVQRLERGSLRLQRAEEIIAQINKIPLQVAYKGYVYTMAEELNR